MPEPRIILCPQFHYHIYNRAIGKENLFTCDADYLYFLSKLKEYIVPVCDVFSYCLMPNHFHLVVRVKDESEIRKEINRKSAEDKQLKNNNSYLSDRLSKLFSNFFNTYAKHYNFKSGRHGSLFQRSFKRKEITDARYLQKLICYVHQNPVEAGFVDKLSDWKYSSFKAIVSKHPTLVVKDEVIELFGDLENFNYCHLVNAEL